MSFGSFVGEATCQSGILFHLYHRIHVYYNHLVSQSSSLFANCGLLQKAWFARRTETKF